jgi:hypothetical protein
VLQGQIHDALRELAGMAVDEHGIAPPTWPGDSTPPEAVQ